MSPSPEYLILWLNVVLDIEVLLQSPVNKLSKQDLTSSVLVNLGKLSLQIIDGSNPLQINSCKQWKTQFTKSYIVFVRDIVLYNDDSTTIHIMCSSSSGAYQV